MRVIFSAILFFMMSTTAHAVAPADNECLVDLEQCSLNCSPLKTWIFSTQEFRDCMADCKADYQRNCTPLGQKNGQYDDDDERYKNKDKYKEKYKNDRDRDGECIKTTKEPKREHPQGKQYGYEKNPNCGKAYGLDKSDSDEYRYKEKHEYRDRYRDDDENDRDDDRDDEDGDDDNGKGKGKDKGNKGNAKGKNNQQE